MIMNASRVSALLVLVVTLSLGPVQAVQFPDQGPKPDLDVRVSLSSAPTPLQLAAAESLRTERPGLTLRWDGPSASPKWLAAPAGEVLSAPSRLAPEAAARAFLETHANLLGITKLEIADLELTSAVSARGGGVHLYFTQRIGGLEVHEGRVNITLSPDGALLFLGSRLHAGVELPSDAILSVAEAVRKAALDVYPDRAFTGEILDAPGPDSVERKTTFAEPDFGRPPRARLILFPQGNETRLAWEVRIAEPSFETDYRTLIDARDGRILARHNMVFYADARVLLATQPEPESEEWAPEQHQLVEIPAGWLGGDDTTLEGNNAVSHLGLIVQPGLSEGDGIYNYEFNTDESALVNAWYWINDAHDRFYALGFDEAAGNFQEDNFGNGGVAGDPVHVVAAIGHAYGSLSTGIDGESAILTFGWFGIPYGGSSGMAPLAADHDGYPDNGWDRSSGFMRDRLFHEYTHAVTARRVGGPADVGCLTGEQSGAMAHGWSQIFPASFFDDPTYGRYSTFGRAWVFDLRHNRSYADFGDRWWSLNGITWGAALWDMRQSMIALGGAEARDDLHELVVESLAGTPCHPTFIDGRDALLAADTLLFGSAHHEVIWNVFAARGMGASASSAGEDYADAVADFTVPAAHVCTTPSIPTGLTATPDGDNAIRLDYDASGAAALEIWRDDPDNPATYATRLGFTTDTASYVDSTVQGGRSYRYHLVALENGGIVCRSAVSSTADATAVGSCDERYPRFIPELTVTDGDPSCAVTLSWNPATEACPGSGEQIVYNIYRYQTPGFQPAERLLVGRTTSTNHVDTPAASYFDWWNLSPYYLVLAEHGTLDDPADHGERGPAQVMDWEPGLPTLGRTTTHFWDFDDGPQGWTVYSNTVPPESLMVLVDPSPTWYGDALWAPDEPAGGSGLSWVTGDAGGGDSTIASHGCWHDPSWIISPEWDGTDGSTILSFDYWANPRGGLEFYYGIIIVTRSNVVPVADNMRDVGTRTTQLFSGPGRYGWQRAELDLSREAAPGDVMHVEIVPYCWGPEEFGIDNVRIERATACGLSHLWLNDIIVDDSPVGWGNGNGFLEPGEIARLSIELYNSGEATAVTPAGTAWTRAPGAAVLDGSDSFPSIAPSATGSSTGDGFVVAAPPAEECTGTVSYEFVFTEASGGRSTAVWSPEFGEIVTETIFEDNFRTDKGWTVSGAGPLQGEWVRGTPIGTYDGSDTANPENCAAPTDRSCYFTGNGGPPADYDDVDPGADAILTSPPLAIDGYRRVNFEFDLWWYDGGNEEDNYFDYDVTADTFTLLDTFYNDYASGWRHYYNSVRLSPATPIGSDVYLTFVATDGDSDEIVEAGVDSVVITGDLQVCDPVGIFAPNEIGDTLLVGKSGADADLQWTVPATDGSHDTAVYYKVYVSTKPDGGFWITEAPTTNGGTWPLGGGSRYFVVSSANGGGTSGEEPPP